MPSDTPSPASAISIRRPRLTDAARIAQLAASLPELDRYAGYLYLLLCDHFAETCAIAEQGDQVVGFVTGYRKPSEPDTLFIWQVATAALARGQGLATALLDHVLDRPAQSDVLHLETTVAADNRASRRLFSAFARRLDVPLRELAGYGVELFSTSHHAEPLLRMGAFQRRKS